MPAKVMKTNTNATVFVVAVLVLLFAGVALRAYQRTKMQRGETFSGLATGDEKNPAAAKPPAQSVKFGFTSAVMLPTIGVQAYVPVGASVSFMQEGMYTVKVSDADQVVFSTEAVLEPDDGTKRKSWFLQKYAFAESYKFESFALNGHNGSVVYPKDSNQGTNEILYFAEIRPNQVLVVRTGVDPAGTGVFYGKDVARFKNFLSGMSIVAPQEAKMPAAEEEQTFRYASARKTIWQDAALGVRVTGPEWVETRSASGDRDASGKQVFSDWYRETVFARPVEVRDGTIEQSFQMFGSQDQLEVRMLDAKFQGKSFADTVGDLLPGAGGCAISWKASPSECDNQEFCYSKKDVVGSLLMKKAVKIGAAEAQLRSMNPQFSNRYDCRAQDEWLVKGKDGQFFVTAITPDGKDFRLEGL